MRLNDLSIEQRRTLRAIRRGAKRNGATRKELEAAVETGLVEAGLTNPSYGDADSEGWRQERKSLYPDPTNLDASVDRFFQETRKVRDKYATSGELAAAVQRPLASLRGKYAERSADAEALLSDGGSLDRAENRVEAGARSVAPSVDDGAARLQAVQMLTRGRSGPLDFALQIRAFDDAGAAAGPQQAEGGREPSTPPSTSTTSGTFNVTGPNPGRLKPQLVSFAEKVAGIYGKSLVGSDGTGHSYRTATGGVSQHSTGNATDIPASGAELTRMGRAALIAAGMPREQAMKQTGGLFNVGGHQIIFHDRQRISGSAHDDHLHISAR